MPDNRSPIRHHLVLHRRDPELHVARFYSLMIQRDLFGTVRLVRNWGRIGMTGQELVEVFADELEAGLSRFQRGGQRMLPVIPSCGLVQDVDHGGQIPCCRERRAAA